jgi:AraC-like DNA-binding protein
MEKGSISICFVDHALREVRARRIDAAPILRAAGIAPHLLNIAQARVSAASYSRLWRLVAQALDDEFFGEDSHPMRVGSFALLCHSVLDCATLEHAAKRAARFFACVLDDIGVALDDDGAERAVLRLTQRSERPLSIFAHETMLILLHGLLCWLVGRRVPILQAGFAYEEPVYSAEYRMMYSAHLAFGQASTQIEFDRRALALPVVQNSESLRTFLDGAPENIVLKYKSERSVTAQARRQLRGLPPAEWPHFDALAIGLNLTGSTLRRRLADEGQSYQGIVDELRRDMAIDALIHTRRSVSEIAADLGFADPGSFHRAFKKWTGSPPAGYRKTRGGGNR